MNTVPFSVLEPRPIDDVLDVLCLHGTEADPGALPQLLVEVPHGADQRAHYDRLRSRLVGTLPDGLEAFFHVNTDVGAWDYGLATARALLALQPRCSVLLLRSLLPRTFIDCNRPADHRVGGDLSQGALTAGIPGYVKDDRDRAELTALHVSYTHAAQAAYDQICGAGGLALTPHTYAPRSVGIRSVGDDIVEQLHWAYEPERYQTWPLRAEIDLLTRDPDGHYLAPPGIEATLLAMFARQGRDVRANDTYNLAPGSLGAHWSNRFPGQVLGLEVRRDLLVTQWRPFDAMTIDSQATDAVAGVLANALSSVMYEAA